ncbi:non-homologous end joining protein Ku [Enhygromyxa salina]|uniref:Putative DNA repair protein YkoV n=1 Tax=Enhygromyxa salina TaxID=215803 RepID=A0A2S9YXS9_9BACT|nr:Ku protein [Enhygromyxa salina]PRQ09898.1 putative DNA repair protein YkoV [Enhygromyxa salina]
MPETDSPSPFWSGTITFGMVTIPVSLVSATRSSAGVSLRQLAPDGAPLRRQYVCPDHERALEPDEIARAYELDSGQYVIMTDDELDALAPEASHDIELRQFVDRAALSPMLFERPYFLLPDSESTKPYHLLAQVLEATGRAGIATFVMRGHQHVVAIVADDQLLRAQTLRFVSELRTPATIGLPSPPDDLDEAQIQRLRAVIRAHTATEIAESELEDEARAQVLALAEQKLAEHRDVVQVPSDEPGPDAEIIDLMRVLQRSLARPA